MPTPTFSFRLPPTEREALIQMSKLYGSPNPRAFLREMVGSMCSGDPKRVQDFNARLIRAAGEQLILELNAPVVKQAAQQPALARNALMSGKPVDVPTIGMKGSFRARMSRAKRAVKVQEGNRLRG